MVFSSFNIREVRWGLEKTLEKEAGVPGHRLRFDTDGLRKYSSSLSFFSFIFSFFFFYYHLESYPLFQEWPTRIGTAKIWPTWTGIAKIRICQRCDPWSSCIRSAWRVLKNAAWFLGSSPDLPNQNVGDGYWILNSNSEAFFAHQSMRTTAL